jgi:hypothetical protein
VRDVVWCGGVEWEGGGWGSGRRRAGEAGDANGACGRGRLQGKESQGRNSIPFHGASRRLAVAQSQRRSADSSLRLMVGNSDTMRSLPSSCARDRMCEEKAGITGKAGPNGKR